MGKADVAVNQMMGRKEIFADFINGIIYHGKQILKPENLECVSGQSGILYETDSGKLCALERRRDIRMKADVGLYSVIFAEESQSRVHYAMPVRNMLYDALEYVRQIQEMEKGHRERGELLTGEEFLSGITKKDRLTPVITIIFYFGGEWDGSRSLYEMMGLAGEEAWCRELETYLPNYKINLVQAGSVEDTNVFTSCLQQIFDMLKYRKDKKKLYQYVRDKRGELMRMDRVELTAAMVMLGEQKRLIRMLEEKKEEDFGMCQAIDELIEDGREEGRAEGRAESILDLLMALGTVAEELKKLILSQSETEVLQGWLHAAAKSASIEEFMQKADLNI